jgi:hypothetical protein
MKEVFWEIANAKRLHDGTQKLRTKGEDHLRAILDQAVYNSEIENDRGIDFIMEVYASTRVYNTLIRALVEVTEGKLRDEAIIRLRYGLGVPKVYTLSEIGRMYDITPQRVEKIEKNVLKRLRQAEVLAEIRYTLAQNEHDELEFEARFSEAAAAKLRELHEPANLIEEVPTGLVKRRMGIPVYNPNNQNEVLRWVYT